MISNGKKSARDPGSSGCDRALYTSEVAFRVAFEPPARRRAVPDVFWRVSHGPMKP